jgi:3-oxoadipate enol-lactonase/4-carboxymuconolactone decarboxylase
MELTRIRTTGAELAVRIDGPPSAPVLVLSNSLGTSLDMWCAQIPALASHYRVVRYDQRGHGASSSPEGPYSIEELGRDVVDLLDVLGYERACIAGLSLGGMVAMWLAANEPHRVERTVLACTSPAMGPPGAWLERAATARSKGTGSLVETLLGRWFTSGFLVANPGIRRDFTRMLEETSDDGYASCCEAIAAMDQHSSLPAITAPTLVVAGAEDPVSAPAVALEMHRAIRGSSLFVIDRAAHLANVERPETFTAAMLAHLAGLPADQGIAERRRVLGDSYVGAAGQRAAASGIDAAVAFQRLITEGAWGRVWSRPGLDRRSRRLLTLALLAGLGRLEEFELHARAALGDAFGSGLDAETIGEVLIHTSVYAGVPAANAAFAVLTRLASSEEPGTAQPGSPADDTGGGLSR